MTSIHDLPEEMLHHVLSYFVFTDPWKSMLLVNKKWKEIVSIYAPKKEKVWKDYLASLQRRYTIYASYNTDLSSEARAKGLYDMFFEAAQIPEAFYSVRTYFSNLVMTYGSAISYYNSLPLKHLLGFMMRHRLKGEVVMLTCSTLYKDSLDPDPHVAALGIRQLTDFAIHECSIFFEYVLQSMMRNLNDHNSLELQSAVLFNLSKLIHVDAFWTMAKDQSIMHDVVPPHLIPSYALLTTEMQKAQRIEVIANYFSVNQLIDHYHTWNLWQRIVVLQQIARNIHSVVDSNEYMALVEFLMTLIIDMSTNRALIASNFGEFFDIVDVLGHFCMTPLNEEFLGTRLLRILAETMVLFQYDFPYLTDAVHGFLGKTRQLMLFMKHDASTDPEFVENFFPLWCDDSAIKNRKLWLVKKLTCQANVTSVKLEIEGFIKYEENASIKRLAQDILDMSNSSI